jgi:uncharacterized membrane protein
MAFPEDGVRHQSVATTNSGLSPGAAGALAYLMWWVSGVVMLLVEPRQGFVRFHAWQSIIAFGTIWLLGTTLWMGGLIAVFVSTRLFQTLAFAGQAVWVAGLLLWGICLYKAWHGERWALPGAGRLAERLARRPTAG